MSFGAMYQAAVRRRAKKSIMRNMDIYGTDVTVRPFNLVDVEIENVTIHSTPGRKRKTLWGKLRALVLWGINR